MNRLIRQKTRLNHQNDINEMIKCSLIDNICRMDASI